MSHFPRTAIPAATVGAAARSGRLRDTVIELHAAVERTPGRPAADVLAAGLRRERALHSSERRFCAEAVYGMIRQRRRIETALGLALGEGEAGRPAPERPASEPAGRLASAPAGLARYLVYLVLCEGLPAAEAAAVFGREAPDFALAARVDQLCPALGARLSYPDWIVGEAIRLLGPEEGESLLRAMNERAPLCVRANRLRGDREALAARLAEEGVAARPTALARDGLLCESRASLFGLESFRDGGFEVQDEGSQLVGELCAPPPGGLVIDGCAGAGGKTLQLASLLEGRGRLLALDPSGRRLEELRRRARRAGLSNVRALEIEPAGPFPPEIERLRGRADRVLCDAPCSGLGVLRRSPEKRWRVEPEDVARLAGEQLGILHRFAELCAVGGRLIYATCTFLREEDEAVVERFLGDRPDFSPVTVREIFGGARAGALGADRFLRLWPHRHGTDGFFAAVLRRSR